MQAHVCLPCVASNLWNQQVDTEWRVFVLQVLLDLVDSFLQHLGSQTDASNDTNTPCKIAFNEVWPATKARDSPAFVTAAASLGPAATFMPVERFNEDEINFKLGRVHTCEHDGVIYAKEGGERGREDGLGRGHLGEGKEGEDVAMVGLVVLKGRPSYRTVR